MKATVTRMMTKLTGTVMLVFGLMLVMADVLTMLGRWHWLGPPYIQPIITSIWGILLTAIGIRLLFMQDLRIMRVMRKQR